MEEASEIMTNTKVGPKPSSEFEKFKDFVRKVVTVPKTEVDKIKEQERREKKTASKKQPT
jgi:hypothetical protein